jgi:hypothetical protein
MSWTKMDEQRTRPRRDSRRRKAACEAERLAFSWCCFSARAAAFASIEGSGGASVAGRSGFKGDLCRLGNAHRWAEYSLWRR